VLLHPNGFCAGAFDPIARRLADSFRVVGVDLIGHGGSTRLDDASDLGYDHMADGVRAVADACGFATFSVCGMSLGGGVAIELAAQSPDRVRRVMLNEAIAFPFPATGAAEPSAAPGNPMAEGARRRRRVWPSRAAMLSSYGSRPPLDELHPESLAGYVRWGTRALPGGQAQLACAPETEATLFSTPPPGGGRRHAADALAALPALVGKAAVLGGTQTYLPREWFEQQATLVGTHVEWVAGGHFFLLEDPDRGAALVRTHLAEQ
jgi:pimeloyl-ACP methyl ester carboxylesterase